MSDKQGRNSQTNGGHAAAPARATLADVARLAEVSTAVVSYVLNNGPRKVSDDLRIRVEQAIAQLGYRRNRLASALISGKSNLVGLLVPDASNPFFGELAREVEKAAHARGYMTLIGNTGHEVATERNYLQAMGDLRVRGIFVTSVNEQQEDTGTSPIIYLHSAPPDAVGNRVLFDDFAGGMLATRHLIGLGYREIFCLAGDSDFGPFLQRRLGWQRAMTDAGLPFEGRYHHVSSDRLEAARQIRRLVEQNRGLRAIFATSDEQALAALRAAAETGSRVPGDIAIVGFDGIREALLGGVRLTTIALPIPQLVARAFDKLESTAGDLHPDNRLPGELVIGETCGAGAAGLGMDQAPHPATRTP